MLLPTLPTRPVNSITFINKHTNVLAKRLAGNVILILDAASQELPLGEDMSCHMGLTVHFSSTAKSNHNHLLNTDWFVRYSTPRSDFHQKFHKNLPNIFFENHNRVEAPIPPWAYWKSQSLSAFKRSKSILYEPQIHQKYNITNITHRAWKKIIPVLSILRYLSITQKFFWPLKSHEVHEVYNVYSAARSIDRSNSALKFFHNLKERGKIDKYYEYYVWPYPLLSLQLSFSLIVSHILNPNSSSLATRNYTTWEPQELLSADELHGLIIEVSF